MPFFYKLAVAQPARDATGNIFINYDPGRYGGVEVLRPTSAGFDVLADMYGGKLALRGDVAVDPGCTTDCMDSGRFYSAKLVGPGPNGRYKIVSSINDCTPNCGQGRFHDKTYSWNGSDYASR